MKYKDGWYYVTFKTDSPDDDHVPEFNDWCEFRGGEWVDYKRHYPLYRVAKIIKAESKC